MDKRLSPFVAGSLLATVLCGACGSTSTLQTGPTAAKCETAISGLPPLVAASGGPVTGRVLTAAECAWSASADGGWVQVQPGNGQGEAPLTLLIAANPDARTRISVLQVNGFRVTLVQEQAPAPPSAAPTPTPPATPASEAPSEPAPPPVPPASPGDGGGNGNGNGNGNGGNGNGNNGNGNNENGNNGNGNNGNGNGNGRN